MRLNPSSVAFIIELDTLGWRLLDTTVATITIHQPMPFNFLGLGGGGVFRIKGLSWMRCFFTHFR